MGAAPDDDPGGAPERHRAVYVPRLDLDAYGDPGLADGGYLVHSDYPRVGAGYLLRPGHECAWPGALGRPGSATADVGAALVGAIWQCDCGRRWRCVRRPGCWREWRRYRWPWPRAKVWIGGGGYG